MLRRHMTHLSATVLGVAKCDLCHTNTTVTQKRHSRRQ